MLHSFGLNETGYPSPDEGLSFQNGQIGTAVSSYRKMQGELVPAVYVDGTTPKTFRGFRIQSSALENVPAGSRFSIQVLCSVFNNGVEQCGETATIWRQLCHGTVEDLSAQAGSEAELLAPPTLATEVRVIWLDAPESIPMVTFIWTAGLLCGSVHFILWRRRLLHCTRSCFETADGALRLLDISSVEVNAGELVFESALGSAHAARRLGRQLSPPTFAGPAAIWPQYFDALKNTIISAQMRQTSGLQPEMSAGQWHSTAAGCTGAPAPTATDSTGSAWSEGVVQPYHSFQCLLFDTGIPVAPTSDAPTHVAPRAPLQHPVSLVCHDGGTMVYKEDHVSAPVLVQRGKADGPTHSLEIVPGSWLEEACSGTKDGAGSGAAFVWGHAAEWSGVDCFVYFSHERVSVPPEGWVHAARSNGACILGTIITEWQAGVADGALLLAPAFQDTLVQRLASLMKLHGFHGWLMNLEAPLDAPWLRGSGGQVQAPLMAQALLSFLRKLDAACMAVLPESDRVAVLQGHRLGPVVWYDSVSTSGFVQWQSALTDANLCFAEACGSIFLDYHWKEEHLDATTAMLSSGAAGHHLGPANILVGVDVFGRGSFSGGRWNTAAALQRISQAGFSTALFAPGWLYESGEVSGCTQVARWSAVSRLWWAGELPTPSSSALQDEQTTIDRTCVRNTVQGLGGADALQRLLEGCVGGDESAAGGWQQLLWQGQGWTLEQSAGQDEQVMRSSHAWSCVARLLQVPPAADLKGGVHCPEGGVLFTDTVRGSGIDAMDPFFVAGLLLPAACFHEGGVDLSIPPLEIWTSECPGGSTPSMHKAEGAIESTPAVQMIENWLQQAKSDALPHCVGSAHWCHLHVAAPHAQLREGGAVLWLRFGKDCEGWAGYYGAEFAQLQCSQAVTPVPFDLGPLACRVPDDVIASNPRPQHILPLLQAHCSSLATRSVSLPFYSCFHTGAGSMHYAQGQPVHAPAHTALCMHAAAALPQWMGTAACARQLLPQASLVPCSVTLRQDTAWQGGSSLCLTPLDCTASSGGGFACRLWRMQPHDTDCIACVVWSLNGPVPASEADARAPRLVFVAGREGSVAAPPLSAAGAGTASLEVQAHITHVAQRDWMVSFYTCPAIPCSTLCVQMQSGPSTGVLIGALHMETKHAAPQGSLRGANPNSGQLQLGQGVVQCSTGQGMWPSFNLEPATNNGRNLPQSPKQLQVQPDCGEWTREALQHEHCAVFRRAFSAGRGAVSALELKLPSQTPPGAYHMWYCVDSNAAEWKWVNMQLASSLDDGHLRLVLPSHIVSATARSLEPPPAVMRVAVTHSK